MSSRTTSYIPLPHPNVVTACRWSVLDVAIGVCVAALVAAFLISHRQHQLWGDGAGLFALFEWAERPWWHVHYHAGYSWAVDVCMALGPFEIGIDNALLASSLPTAFAVACTYWLARRLGHARVRAFLATAVVALSPTFLFFGTLLEVHALHLGAAAAALLITHEAAVWCGRRAFAWSAHAAFAALALTHATAVVLVPGFLVWLHVVGRRGALAGLVRREIVAFHLRQSLVAIALVALSIAAFEIPSRFLSTGTGARYMFEILVMHMQPWDLGYSFDEWIEPLGFAVVPVALAVLALALPYARLRRRGERTRLFLAFPGPCVARFDANERAVALAAAAWCVTPFLFFNWWNVRGNEGGYLAPLFPALVLLVCAASRAVATRRAQRAVWVLLAVCTLAQGVAALRQFDALERAHSARRPPVADVALELLPTGGTLVTGRVERWSIRTEAPHWSEFEVERLVEVDESNAFVHDLDTLLAEQLHITGRRVVVDLSYRERLMDPASPLFERLTRFEQHLARDHTVHIVDDPRCRVALLEPIAPAANDHQP